MTTYIVTVAHDKKSSFDKGWTKFRIDAPTEEMARKAALASSEITWHNTNNSIKRIAVARYTKSKS